MRGRVDRLHDWFEWVDVRAAGAMARYGVLLLRISIGIVFLMSGAIVLGATVRGGGVGNRTQELPRRDGGPVSRGA